MENNLKDQHYKNMGIRPQMDTLTFEAESVAYTVCSALGIDTSEYSFGYIAGWSQGKDIKELKSALDLICDTASTMIFHVENRLTEKYEEKYGKKHGESALVNLAGETEKTQNHRGLHK